MVRNVEEEQLLFVTIIVTMVLMIYIWASVEIKIWVQSSSFKEFIVYQRGYLLRAVKYRIGEIRYLMNCLLLEVEKTANFSHCIASLEGTLI